MFCTIPRGGGVTTIGLYSFDRCFERRGRDKVPGLRPLSPGTLGSGSRAESTEVCSAGPWKEPLVGV